MVATVESRCQESCRVLALAGDRLWVGGYFIGPDRCSGMSPFGFANDAVVGLGIAVQIAGELGQSTTVLLEADQRYGAAALLRQLVEVEYLIGLFALNKAEAGRWLRASDDELHRFFRPASVRNRSGVQVSKQQFKEHLRLGGHPNNGSRVLLPDHTTTVPATSLWLDLQHHLESMWAQTELAAANLGFAVVLADLTTPSS